MIRDIDSGYSGTIAPRINHYIEPVRDRKSICLSQNLLALADAFSQLTSLEVLAIPQPQRVAVGEALDEVWQILELVGHLEEETATLSQAELEALNPWSLR